MPDSSDSSGPRLFDHTLIAPQTGKKRVLPTAWTLHSNSASAKSAYSDRQLEEYLSGRNPGDSSIGRENDTSRISGGGSLPGRHRPVDQIASDVAGSSTLAHVTSGLFTNHGNRMEQKAVFGQARSSLYFRVPIRP